MNKIIKSMAKNQNAKSKMNAGQLRESAKLFIWAIIELSNEDKSSMVKSISKEINK